jgi:hypothetical protein
VRSAALLIALVVLAATPACTRIVEDPDGVGVTAEDAGPFPEDYESIARRWAVQELSRFSKIEGISASRPSPGMWERKGIGASTTYGWVTNVTVSGKDRVGMSTGRVKHQLLIRDGEVVESRYQP